MGSLLETTAARRPPAKLGRTRQTGQTGLTGLVGLVVVATGLVGGAGGARAAEPVTVERIVAVVNHEVILLSEAKEKAAQIGQPVDESGPPEQRRRAEQTLRQIVDRMVDDALVLQQAQDLKLRVESAEIERAVDEVKKQNNLDDDQFKDALAQQGYSIPAYREELRKQLLRLKVINTAVRSHVNISDEDVRAYYDQTVRKAGGKRTVKVRHVLVAVPPGADEKAVLERRARAAQVVEEARGGKDFAALVKQFSDDAATRDEGGELGWLSGDDGLPKQLADVMFTMEPKEVRGPIRTDRGFEVLQVMERKDSDNARPFEEAKDSIRSQLYGQQIEKQTQSWLQDLRRKAHVDVRL